MFIIGTIFKEKIELDEEYDEISSDNSNDEEFCVPSSQQYFFVRAALKMKNDAYWIGPLGDPSNWEFKTFQEKTPEWFNLEEYEEKFRMAVQDWWNRHVHINENLESLRNGYSILKDCTVECLEGNAKAILADSRVKVMKDNAIVYEMFGSSIVQYMRNESNIYEVRDKSMVGEMRDFSRINALCDSSSVQEMYDKSCVLTMYHNSSITEMSGFSRIDTMNGNSIVRKMHDYTCIRCLCNSSEVSEMYGDSIVMIMYNNNVKKMHDFAMIRNMPRDAHVCEMTSNAMAIAQGIKESEIWISGETDFTFCHV